MIPDLVQQPAASRGPGDGVNVATELPASLRATPAPRRPAAGAAADERTLADLVWTLWERRWTVAAVLGSALAAAALYLLAAPPTYRASTLIQVESRSRPGTGFQEVETLFEEDTPREGEMRILASRPLLEAVVGRLHLDVEARVRTFPLVGAAIARRHDGAGLAAPRLGLGRYGWGGESIAVAQLSVSDGLVGEPLTLVALEGHRYRVAADDGTVLAEGTVGEPATGTDGDRSVRLIVSALEARAGTEFALVKRHPLDVVEELQDTLAISEHGRGTGLIEVALAGNDPGRIAATLDALSASYVRHSVERTSADAAKMLRVLEAQLPLLQANLQKSERALNDFRERNRTVDVSLEAEAMLARLAELDRGITEDELKAEETQRHTALHPDTPVATGRLDRLRAERGAVEARMQQLPALELQSMRLSRSMNAAAQLYLLVLNRAEELRIVKSGWIGNARILEAPAVPHRPIGPKPALALALAALLGLAGGVAAAFAKDAFAPPVASPDDVEEGTGLAVLATIPHSAAQRRLTRQSRRRAVPPLSVARPADPAVEDLRGLRTSVQYALQHARNRVVSVTGLAPGAGKSFVGTNLAQLLAAAGEKVVLVEGDLRLGGLHRAFGVEPVPGLSELLNGAVELDAALRPTGTPGLDLLPRGALPANPAELLAGERLRQVLGELGRRYGVVLLDAPPILAVSDAALVGRHAGVNLVVLRDGAHSLPEISDALKRLVRSGVTFAGAVLNDVRPSRRRGGRAARYRGSYGTSA